MSDEDSSGWQLTESDPGVFTELLKTLGVPLVVDDLYSLDPAALHDFAPVRALIFLFKWLPSGPTPTPAQGGTPAHDFPGFFAQQVVANACATLAVLNAVANIPRLRTGPDLAALLDFTLGMDALTRGLALTSADWLRAAHNALSPPAAVSLDGLGLPKGKAEDAYHFVVYVPVGGRVYELDGLRDAPLDHGAFVDRGEGWLAIARDVIERRIATYPDGALEFNLQAVHDDPLPILQTELEQAQQAGHDVLAEDLAGRLADENAKRERWAFENALRRHNHFGLIHALCLALAKSGKLDAAEKNAREKMAERVARARERGESEMDED